MGRADYFKLGDWNALCDYCGFKFKGSELKKTWQGYWACPKDWEPRQPQDFARSIAEHPTPPFVRHPADVILSSICTPNGRTSIAGFAVAGCAIADYVDPAFDPSVTN